MANEFTIDAATIADLGSFNKSIGPKEVRTPNMTVITHDIEKVQRVQERGRAASFYPTMCSLGGCVGTPKEEAYDRNDCP